MPKQILALTCPTCASVEVEPAHLGSYRCRHCRGLLLVRDAAPQPGQPAAPRLTPLPSIWSWLLPLLCVLMSAAAAVYLSRPRRRSAPPPATPRLPLRPSTPPRLELKLPPLPSGLRAPPAMPPRAELRDVREGRNRSGSRFWLARYVNTGESPIGRPAARVSLFNARGERVAEQTGYAHQDWLGPGEEAPLLVALLNPPGAARVEVAVVTPAPPLFGWPPVRLRVREQSVQAGALGPSLVGTVRNHTEDAARFVQVVVVGRDRAGAMVSLSHGYATETTLEPGRETGFQIPLRFYEIAPAARYEAQALAQGPNR